MENLLVSADFKTLVELTKAQQAKEFVENSQKISKLKEVLKIYEERNETLEKALIPEIGLKYQPQGENFVLTVKTKEGTVIPSYKDILNTVQDVFKFNERDRLTVDSLIEANKASKKPTVKQSIIINK
jgi:hypothetical protein